MKKFLTVLFVFAALLTFTVGSASAASFFVAQNGTQWKIIGMQANGTYASDFDNGTSIQGTGTLRTMVGETAAGTISPDHSQNFGYFDDGVTTVAAPDGTQATTFAQTGMINATYTNNTQGSFYVKTPVGTPVDLAFEFNGTANSSSPTTSTLYAAIERGNNFIAGVSNQTAVYYNTNSETDQTTINLRTNPGDVFPTYYNGANIVTYTQYKNATSALVSGLGWYVYSVCTPTGNATERIGYVDTTNAVKYSTLADATDNGTTSSETLTWGINADGTVNASTPTFTFMTNGTLEKSGNMVIGVSNSSNTQCLSVFVKGATFSTDALKNKTFKTVGFGRNGTTTIGAVGSIGYVRLDNLAINGTASSTTNFMPGFDATKHYGVLGSLTGDIAATTSTFNTISHTALTLGTTTFYGVQRTDGNMFVGIAKDSSFMTKGGIYFIFPAASAPVSAFACTTAEAIAHTGINFNVTAANRATYGLLDNATQYFVDVTSTEDYTAATAISASYLGAAKAAIEATTSYTNAQYITAFTAPAGFTKVTNFAPQVINMTADVLNNNKYALVAWPLTTAASLGDLVGRTPSSVSMYKFMNITSAGNQTVALTMVPGTNATSGTKRDGYYWWSKASSSQNATILSDHTFTQATYDAGDQYILWMVLKDNGNYDADLSYSKIIDPPVGAIITGSSSSSSSGCMFNPAASFGLEWMLLLIAPVVAVLRNRFRK